MHGNNFFCKAFCRQSFFGLLNQRTRGTSIFRDDGVESLKKLTVVRADLLDEQFSVLLGHTFLQEVSHEWQYHKFSTESAIEELVKLDDLDGFFNLAVPHMLKLGQLNSTWKE